VYAWLLYGEHKQIKVQSRVVVVVVQSRVVVVVVQSRVVVVVVQSMVVVQSHSPGLWYSPGVVVHAVSTTWWYSGVLCQASSCSTESTRRSRT